MPARVTLLTDGSSSGLALARWLQTRLDDTRVIEELGQRDLESSVAARRDAQLSERVVAIGRAPVPRGAVDASRALEVVADWTRDVPPIEVRTTGAHLLDERVKSSAPGSGELLSLSLRLAGSRLRTPHRRPGKRGRPPGLNPFRGAGLELCTVLLLSPGNQWTERALAMRTNRAASMVHKLVAELTRRGHLRRSKQGAQLVDAPVLRDDILADWRGRVGVPRRAMEFARKGTNIIGAAIKFAGRASARCVAAGPSAIQDPALRPTGKATIYVEGDPLPALSNGFTHAPPGLGDLIVWSPLDPAVFLEPQAVGSVSATNAVITYLDLAVSGDPRLQEAAASLWKGIGNGSAD
jgi:hypothetical protein